MSGDINGLPGDNTRIREAAKTGSEADGPEHVNQLKQRARLLGRMGAGAGPSPDGGGRRGPRGSEGSRVAGVKVPRAVGFRDMAINA